MVKAAAGRADIGRDPGRRSVAVPVREARTLRRLARLAAARRLAAPLLVLAALLLSARAGALPQSGPPPGAPVPRPVLPALPAGWKQVSYRAVRFAVPASWPVYDLAADPARCALLDVHAVYLGHQGAAAACPALALGRSEALQVEPLDAAVQASAALATVPATVGGEAARVDPSAATAQVFVAALPQAGVLLRLAWGQDEALARRVLATVTVASASAGSESGPATTTPQAAAAPPSVTVTGYFHGWGFDTCAAPSLATLAAWRASPFRAVGIYVGGRNRACGDGNLSAAWVAGATGLGWYLAPLYVGSQAPCVDQPDLGLLASDPAVAAAQGTAEAGDALRRAAAFGLGPGSPLFFDMEAYDRSAPGCSRAVLSFLSAWTAELHRQGYHSGVYGSAASPIADLVGAYNQPGFDRPDAVWFADWTGVPTLTDPYLPSWAWAAHQRIAQFRGGHLERYGGVTLDIDSDLVDTSLPGAAGS